MFLCKQIGLIIIMKLINVSKNTSTFWELNKKENELTLQKELG